MACKTCMAARKRMAERMGLDRYNRLLGKRLPLDPEDERSVRAREGIGVQPRPELNIDDSVRGASE